MIKLYQEPTYLKGGKICQGCACDQDNARKGTITYTILNAHNRGPDMKKLRLHFDSIGVYDNTYVGIMQTARACDLKKFSVPCVFTNCHNALCAVGGTINADLHRYAYSACQKYGGIYVPPHQAVIHQYMREMIVGSGEMSIVSDSHTRYGALGSLSIGEGGPELAKAMLGKDYELNYPQVIGVYLKNSPMPWIGPMDVALTLIGAVFSNGFVKNKVLEFVGPGIASLSMDFRNGIDTMTTESACLSSVWETDERTREYFAIHGRESAFRRMSPTDGALYDGMIEIDLSKVEPMLALPFHPSNVYSVRTVLENPGDVLSEAEERGKKVFENNDVSFHLKDKIVDGVIRFDQAVVAGCCAGSFENIYCMGELAQRINRPLGALALDIYPASQPINYELDRIGTIGKLLAHGALVKTAFCGPCFGAGDTPSNNAFSIRHVTRNFPNREGSNPLMGQVASVVLADAKTIAATAFNGGKLSTAEPYADHLQPPQYHFCKEIYDGVVYNGYGHAKPTVEMELGPSIKDWPKMQPLQDNLLLRVASVIRDEVTTTDELIPSGETASYRSDPYRISEYTLIRKDPEYRARTKEARAMEEQRLAGNFEGCKAAYAPLAALRIDVNDPALAKTTGLGSILYAKRPGDGSAREYAASCQRVLGGLANLCIAYATKRYRSNCINWGILPFTLAEDPIDLQPDDAFYIPNVRKGVQCGQSSFEAYVLRAGTCRKITLNMDVLSQAERDTLLAGCLINYYKTV